ncbi:hypothetical protein [Streptomyces sp. MMBL 11-1]|uniref:hypothetical protein n=1 Tax=Streptomyces sp. MMBL 11-1 TaxID=3026420 RepID=UPI0023618399|nr:hypothetical protein [Streptomyces sp. MMBL 11-1]
MTQPTLDIDALLTEYGAAWRRAHPQLTSEEEELRSQRCWDRILTEFNAELDTNNTTACSHCHRQRPRRFFCEPRFYPMNECANVRQPWHYRRVWGNPKADRREMRRHRRRVRKGRAPRVPRGGVS